MHQTEANQTFEYPQYLNKGRLPLEAPLPKRPTNAYFSDF